MTDLRGFPVMYSRRGIKEDTTLLVLHNMDDPCGRVPKFATRSDIATAVVGVDEAKLCDYCDWPDGAHETLEKELEK